VTFVVWVAAVLVAMWLALRAPPLAPGVPYRWGAYCAYNALLDAAGTVLHYFTGERPPRAAIVIAVALCAVPAAFGLLKRYRFGVWMLLALAVVGLVREPITFDLVIIPTVFYFQKRWQYLA
jgi:hypothetical protein